MRRPLELASYVVLLSYLAACKGGGGGGSKSAPAAPPPPADTSTAGSDGLGTGTDGDTSAGDDDTSGDGDADVSDGDDDTGTDTTTPTTQAGQVSIDTAGNVTATDSQLRLKGSATLVPAQSDASLPTAAVGTLQIATGLRAFDDPNTDYEKLISNNVLSDPSMNAIASFSKMFCLLAESGYFHMVGQGAYVAMVNDNRCFAFGQTYSETKTTLSKMTVEAVREANKPVTVSFWLDRSDGSTVTAKATIAKGATQSNPYGIFRMNYKIATDSSPTPTKGAIEAYETVEGKVVFNAWEGESSSETKAATVFTYDEEAEATSSGVARVAITDKSSAPANLKYEPDWVTGFNSTHYLAKQSKENESTTKVDVCRDRIDYRLSVWPWNYRLFDKDTGAAVELWNTYRNLSRTVSGVSGTSLGNVTSVNGIYFDRPSGLNYTPTVNDGDTIYVDDVPDWTNKLTYTARVTLGVLKKRVTGEELTTSHVKSSWFIASESGTDDVIIKYDDTLGKFEVIARYESDENGSRYAPVTPTPFAVSSSTVEVAFENDTNPPSSMVTLHLDSGNGYSLVKATVVRDDERVEPSSNITLWCFEDCPKGGVSTANIDSYFLNGGSETLVYYPDATNVSEMHSYTYNATTGLLMDDANSNAVVFDHRPAGSEGFGLTTGELIPDSLHTTLSSNSTYFQSLPKPRETYVWSSGYFISHRKIVLVDAQNEPLQLSKPSRFLYTHSKANDRRGKDDNPRYGNYYELSFSEYGQLRIIPADKTEDVNGSLMAFTFKDGTQLGSSYVVKAIAADESMPTVDRSLCDSIVLGTPLALPTSALFKDPNLGSAPSVTAAPKIVSGVPSN
jgi:hypothetical protein